MTWHDKVKEIQRLTPQERASCYFLALAKLSEVGARVRTRHIHESNDYDEKWTQDEEKEWDDACDECDIYGEALSEEEIKICKPITLAFSYLARAEWPLIFKA